MHVGKPSEIRPRSLRAPALGRRMRTSRQINGHDATAKRMRTRSALSRFDQCEHLRTRSERDCGSDKEEAERRRDRAENMRALPPISHLRPVARLHCGAGFKEAASCARKLD